MKAKIKPAKRIGYRAYQYNGFTIEFNEEIREWSIFTEGADRQWVDTWDTLSACKTHIKNMIENN